MLSEIEIKKIAAKAQVDPGIIERDYVLNKILDGLSQQPEFQSNFVFKGGTAIKKLFFSDWRFSEDLDFTLMQPVEPIAIRRVFQSACRVCQKKWNLTIQAQGLAWPSEGNQKHPGYVGLKLYYEGPLLKASGYKNIVKVDITQDEPIVGGTKELKLIPVYPDDGNVVIKSYSIEEVLGEKLRSILERGKSRDYYDVWALLKQYGKKINSTETVRIFKAKCGHKQIAYSSPDDFLMGKKIELAAGYWKRGLAHQLSNLPAFDEVIGELRILFEKLFRE